MANVKKVKGGYVLDEGEKSGKEPYPLMGKFILRKYYGRRQPVEVEVDTLQEAVDRAYRWDIGGRTNEARAMRSSEILFIEPDGSTVSIDPYLANEQLKSVPRTRGKKLSAYQRRKFQRQSSTRGSSPFDNTAYCDYNNRRGFYPQGCNGNPVEYEVTIHYDEYPDGAQDTLELCGPCARRVKKDAERDGYRVEMRKSKGTLQRNARSNQPTIVPDVNYGKVINEVYREWLAIKNQSDWDRWAEKVRDTRFGTYKNMTILSLFKGKWSPRFRNSVEEKDFIEELERAYGLSGKRTSAYRQRQSNQGRHSTSKRPGDPTYSAEWSGVSYAPHARGRVCARCGGHVHNEDGNFYCPYCDDYVRTNKRV